MLDNTNDLYAALVQNRDDDRIEHWLAFSQTSYALDDICEMPDYTFEDYEQ